MLEGELCEQVIKLPLSVEIAMPEVEAPVTGTEVDTSDPSGSVMSIAGGILGVGLLTVVVNYGSSLGSWATDQINGATGVQGGSAGDVIQGEF
jgi:hypothetical protein